MEIHDADPTTDSNDDPWDEVSTRFGELGRRLKATYRTAADDAGPDEDEIRGAFATLAGAWDQVAASISDVLKDPETREELRRAAGSLAGALGSTLSHLATEFDDTADQEEE